MISIPSGIDCFRIRGSSFSGLSREVCPKAKAFSFTFIIAHSVFVLWATIDHLLFSSTQFGCLYFFLLFGTLFLSSLDVGAVVSFIYCGGDCEEGSEASDVARGCCMDAWRQTSVATGDLPACSVTGAGQTEARPRRTGVGATSTRPAAGYSGPPHEGE